MKKEKKYYHEYQHCIFKLYKTFNKQLWYHLLKEIDTERKKPSEFSSSFSEEGELESVLLPEETSLDLPAILEKKEIKEKELAQRSYEVRPTVTHKKENSKK